jgi:lipopolysaccharide export system ATP-binding protein
MIKINNLSKSLNGKTLFKNINTKLNNKKITGLLGANGAGKTSLFRAIAGLSKVDQGEITLFSDDLTNKNIEERSKLGLSYVPQENSLFEELSLRQNLEIVVELKFKSIEKYKNEEIDTLLSKMNLKDKQGTKAKLLSGGEKRKAEILRSILLDAKFILLDEPFAGVDPISVDEINKILKDLSKNVGIFISDHNFRDVIKVCDDIILMNQGEVILMGSSAEIINDPIAKEFYFGREN